MARTGHCCHHRRQQREAKQRYREKVAPRQELRRCARHGDLDRVRELVKKVVDVNCVYEYGGWTPLLLACVHGHVHIARFLLQKGAKADAVNNHGNTSLGLAVCKGHIAVAELLLGHGSASVETQYHTREGTHYSLLGVTICRRNVAMVALLLRLGANTEKTTHLGGKTVSALFLACLKSNMSIAQLLLEHGVNANAIVPLKTSTGITAMSPLCRACRRGKMEMAQLLIQHGARVIFDGAFPRSPSPLAWAVKLGTLQLVRFLLDNSAFSADENVRMTTAYEIEHPLSRPLRTAIKHNKSGIVRLLVERGANVNDKPFLHQCTKHKKLRNIARVLLRAGASVNLVDHRSGQTPLWSAAKNGQVKLVQEFLKAGADISICDESGETPLGVTYRKGRKTIVYLLLRTSRPHVWSDLAEIW